MEIERKFLIKSLPDNLESYSCDTLIQAYISTEPVIRVRQKNEDYGFCMAEVEFPDIDSANAYNAPAWFGLEVTMDSRFHNSSLSKRNPAEVQEFLELIQKM